MMRREHEEGATGKKLECHKRTEIVIVIQRTVMAVLLYVDIRCSRRNGIHERVARGGLFIERFVNWFARAIITAANATII
jgi:hypothetical protein